MARDFYINGPALVQIWGGEHLGEDTPGFVLSDLGLTAGPVRVSVDFRRADVFVDDYGPDVPADVLTRLATAAVRMELIHFDRTALDVCMREATGGTTAANVGAGTMAPAGTLMGGYKPIHASGNHFITVYVTSPELVVPWRFPACQLAESPLEWPIGATASAVALTWRAIPYQIPLLTGGATSGNPNYSGEIVSSGAVLWDHEILA